MRDGACVVPRPSAPWQRRQWLSYNSSPAAPAARPTAHVATANVTTRPANAARVAQLLIIRFGASPCRIGLGIADRKLVVRLDQFAVLERHVEHLLGVDDPPAEFILHHGDLLVLL